VWNFTVYTGKVYGGKHPGEQTSSRIALELANDLLGKGCCLYLDIWYTSPKLVDTLYARNTDVVGTMRSNRKEFPECVKQARLQKGELVTAFRQKQMILKWKDKRDVTIVTSFHDGALQDATTKKGVVQKPASVLDYERTWGTLTGTTLDFEATKWRVKGFVNIIRRYLEKCLTLYA
jgi:hypothetical protein